MPTFDDLGRRTRQAERAWCVTSLQEEVSRPRGVTTEPPELARSKETRGSRKGGPHHATTKRKSTRRYRDRKQGPGAADARAISARLRNREPPTSYQYPAPNRGATPRDPSSFRKRVKIHIPVSYSQKRGCERERARARSLQRRRARDVGVQQQQQRQYPGVFRRRGATRGRSRRRLSECVSGGFYTRAESGARGWARALLFGKRERRRARAAAGRAVENLGPPPGDHVRRACG